MQTECCGGHALPRRHIIRGGFAAAAAGTLGTRGSPSVPGAALAASGDVGARAIDIHAHYYPQAFLDILGEAGKPHGLEHRAAPDGFFIGPQHYGAKFTDLALRLAEMDQHGVETQALLLTAPMLYRAPPDLSLRLARAWNDAAGAAHQAHPTRFVGLATLPMGDPDRALGELDRAAGHPRRLSRHQYRGSRPRRSPLRPNPRPYRCARPRRRGAPHGAARHRREAP